jgi:hypothetical protein
MSGIGNENFLTGGTGAALFGGAGSGADAKAKATAHQVPYPGQKCPSSRMRVVRAMLRPRPLLTG